MARWQPVAATARLPRYEVTALGGQRIARVLWEAMPNNRNAAKAARQNDKRRLRNRIAKTSLRNVVRKTREVVVAGDAASAEAALKTAAKKLDQAASKKFIHRNKAARIKSRLTALAAKTSATKTPAAAKK